MLCTFSFGSFQIYQNKSAKNIAVHFIGTIVPIKCMPKISAVGLFCLDKFENNQTRTCTTFFRTSKLTEVYFSYSRIEYSKIEDEITIDFLHFPTLTCIECIWQSLEHELALCSRLSKQHYSLLSFSFNKFQFTFPKGNLL